MADQKQKSKGGGSKKIGRDKEKCARWRTHHDPRSVGHKFSASKERRHCGPLGYYLRAQALKSRERYASD
jgi:hypothetical protein